MARREFSQKVRTLAFERANGWCEECGAKLFPGGYQYDHVLPAALGGDRTLDNCKVICLPCHGLKTTKEDRPKIHKADRARVKIMDGKKRKSRPIPGSKASGWRKRMDGTVERR